MTNNIKNLDLKKGIILWSIIIVIAIVLSIALSSEGWREGLIYKYRYHIPIISGFVYGWLTGEGDFFARASRISKCIVLALIIALPFFLLT